MSAEFIPGFVVNYWQPKMKKTKIELFHSNGRKLTFKVLPKQTFINDNYPIYPMKKNQVIRLWK
jgi:hypothetical protein